MALNKPFYVYNRALAENLELRHTKNSDVFYTD